MEIISTDEIRDWIHAGSPTIGVSDMRIKAFNDWLYVRSTYGNDDQVSLTDAIRDATAGHYPPLNDIELSSAAQELLNSDWLLEFVRVRQEQAFDDGVEGTVGMHRPINPYRART